MSVFYWYLPLYPERSGKTYFLLQQWLKLALVTAMFGMDTWVVVVLLIQREFEDPLQWRYVRTIVGHICEIFPEIQALYMIGTSNSYRFLKWPLIDP